MTAEELVNEPQLIIQTTINADTPRPDTIVSLYDASGALIAENDDRAGNDRSSFIELPLAPGQEGVYWVRVRAFENIYDGTRPYTLRIALSELCDEIDNDLDGEIDEGLTGCLECDPDIYEENDELNAAIGFGLGYMTELNHCLDSADYFRFNLREGQAIDIETYLKLESDTVVELFSADGVSVASNDDRARNQYASLIEGYVPPLTSTYSLFVRQFNGIFGPARPYRLLVREACAPDTYEHDDLPTEARALTLDTTVTRETHTLCDPDWVKVTLARGQWLELNAEFTDTNIERGTERGLTLRLSRDFGRQLIVTSASSATEGANLIWEAPAEGVYWIALESSDQSYGGDLEYALSWNVRSLEVCDDIDNDLDDEVDEEVLNACGVCGEVPAEVCDGDDNDCDGMSDEGVLNACGQCGEVPVEACDGVDNDCDTAIDEGVVNACGGCGVLPAEVCDEIDNDCDGSVDEGVVNTCGRCGEQPSEVCEGTLDEDCDGVVDEGCAVAGVEVEAGALVEAGAEGGDVAGVDGAGALVEAGAMAGDSAGELSAGDTAGDSLNEEDAGDITLIVGGSLEEGGMIALEGGDVSMEADERRRSRGASSGCESTTEAYPSSLWLLLSLLWWLRVHFITQASMSRPSQSVI